MLKNKFKQLPLGTIKADGFLKDQLILQRDNFTSKMDLYPDYGDNSAWLGGVGESWERGPYYLRGLIALAYTLGDKDLLLKVDHWVKSILSMQREDGNFYPFVNIDLNDEELIKRREESKNEWWAKMPVLMALRDYFEAEERLGHQRLDILEFLKKYFLFQLDNLPKRPLKDWAYFRGGDNMEVAMWLYEKDHDDRLLTLTKILYEQTFPWVYEFNHQYVRQHVVNTTQAYKTPYLAYKLFEDPSFKDSLKNGLKTIYNDHGRIDYLPNADERARDNLFTRGTETCAISEGLLSFEICGLISGDSYLYDLIESYAYNSLPNCFTYKIDGYCYFQLQNQVMATLGSHEFDCDHGDSCAFGMPDGFDCCFANAHMAYPKFIQNMYVMDEDGLVATCYGPNILKTKINNKEVTILQKTNYPYSSKIKFIYQGQDNNFTIKFRIPLWCQNFLVKVNSKEIAFTKDDYISLTREFHDGDVIEINFEMELQRRDYHDDSIYFKRGVLLYCLPIKEQWCEVDDERPYREMVFKAYDFAKTKEAYPLSKWNYAICGDKMTYVENDSQVVLNQNNTTSLVKVEGILDPNWKLKGNIAAHHPLQKLSCGDKEELTLIPYSCSRLKISIFPKVYDIDESVKENLSINVKKMDGYYHIEYDLDPNGEEYLLQIEGEKDLLHIHKNHFLAHRNCLFKEKFNYSNYDNKDLKFRILVYNHHLINKSSYK